MKPLVLPLWLIAGPRLMVLLIVPVVLLLVAATPVAVAGAILTPPCLLGRRLRGAA